MIRLGRNLLVALQGDLDDETILAIEEHLTDRLDHEPIDGVLIDVGGLFFVDSFLARCLHRIASIISVMGADAVVVGIRPAVAITLVELGLSLQGLKTALNAEHGVRLLAEQKRSRHGASPRMSRDNQAE